MIRVTTSGSMRAYRANLNRSSNNMYNAMQTVLTQRNFNSYADDPAAASQAFKLRRSHAQISAQYTNCNAVIYKFSTAYSAMENTKSSLANSTSGANASILQGLNDPTGVGRASLGQLLSSTAEGMVQDMNSQYGEDFLFSGKDTLTVPLTWDDDGNILFRGINVNTTDPDELKRLNDMAAESNYVDVGMGLKETADGELITSSAVNSSLSALNILGYGVDGDGDPKNVIAITKRLGELLSNCTNDDGEAGGAWASDSDQEEAVRLQQKLAKAIDRYDLQYTQLSTNTATLNSQISRLEDNADNLNEQFMSIEQVDMADAITSFSWAKYCYNAAIKVGNGILSQSLIDYMQ